MTDWHVVEGHLSSASCSPGAQVMARPHPQVLLLLQATAETSPLGCHVAVSMEMRRQASHGSDSHLYGQRLGISKETSLPNSTCMQVVMVPAPTPKSFTLSYLLSSFKPVQARLGTPPPSNSPTIPAMAVLPLWSLLGTVVRCYIRPASLGRAWEGIQRKGTAHSVYGSCSIMIFFFLFWGCERIIPKCCLL